MSTFTSVSSAPLGLRPASSPAHKGVDGIQRRTESARGLTAMLLAAVVAAMVVVADRLISTWADGHLFLAWVFLWVVIFAGSALFAGTARRLAHSTMRSLDGWSQTLAQARAEARNGDAGADAATGEARKPGQAEKKTLNDAGDGVDIGPAFTQHRVAGGGRAPGLRQDVHEVGGAVGVGKYHEAQLVEGLACAGVAHSAALRIEPSACRRRNTAVCALSSG